MESIGKVMTGVVNMQGLSKKLIRKEECIICHTEISYECDIRSMRSGHYTICSEECYKKLCEKEAQEYYNSYVRDIPLKYRDIEADIKLVNDNYSQNLFITGKSGSGKTVLAAGIIKKCIKNHKSFKWIGYSGFIMELQNLYKSNEESPFKVAEEIANFDGVLVIDDLGAEKISEWVRQITYFIINEREQRMLPIIITSNFSLEEIAEQIDVRISSRIAGMCKSIKLSGKDRRLDELDKKWNRGEPKRKYFRGI